MARKAVTAAIGAVGAGANSGRIVMPSPDDASPRRVVGVKTSLTTKGMTLTLDINSTPQVVIDAAILGQWSEELTIDYTVPINIQMSFSLLNTTGGALAAGDFVTLIYEV